MFVFSGNVTPVQSPHSKNGVPSVDAGSSAGTSPAGSIAGEELSVSLSLSVTKQTTGVFENIHPGEIN